MSTLKVANLQHPSSNNTNIVLDANGGITSSGGMTLGNTRTSANQKFPIRNISGGDIVFSIDPTWSTNQLQTLFNTSNVDWYVDSTAPGGYAIQLTGPTSVGGPFSSGTPYIPVENNDTFYVECWIKSDSNTVVNYIGSADYDTNLTILTGNPGTYSYWGANARTSNTTWVKFSGYVSGTANSGSIAGSFPATTKYFTPLALFNYNGSANAKTYISGWKVRRASKKGATFFDGVRINSPQFASTAWNCIYMLYNNVLYNTSGTSAAYVPYLGRGNQATAHYGVDKFRAITFPNETTATITNFGGDGYNLSFALFSNGNLYTWGYNVNGECGVGDTTVRYIPTLAATGVTDVWGPRNYGYDKSNKFIIRKTDGYLYATGYNGYGQLGVGDTTNRSSFTQLTSLGNSILNVWNLGTIYGALFVQKTDYTIWVAGYGGYGQLGTADTNSYSTPVNVTSNWGGGGSKVIKRITGGSGYHTASAASSNTFWIMLLDDGTTTVVKGAGYNGDGELGDGSTTNRSTPVSPNVGSGRIADIASTGSGVNSSCLLLKEDGTLYGWGYNQVGQIGYGNTTQQNSPVICTTGVAALMSEGMDNYYQGYISQAFIKKTDGYLYGTGQNGGGELGVGDATNRSSWTKVLLPQNFFISKLAWLTCNNPTHTLLAVSTDGRLYAWGYNYYYTISNDTNNAITTPVQINLPLGG